MAKGYISNRQKNLKVGISSYTESQKVLEVIGKVGIGTRIDIAPYDTLSSGTLSFEGSAGQLFSITNNLTSGSIFSVNDVSGIPSIDVDADGTIQLAPYGSTEYVGIGTTNPTAKLDVNGTVKATLFSGSGASLTNIPNGALDNSTVSYGGVTLSLGGSDSTPAFNLQDATNYPYSSLTGITTDIVGDTTPQLGGDLDLNSNDITGTGNIDITGSLNVSGVSTFQDNVYLGDNDKIIFGAGSDLQIWHSGSNSIIQDSGAGNLFIQGGTSVRITDTSANEMAVFNDGGSVELYNNASKKFETTGYGVSVYNTLQAPQLNISGIATAAYFYGDGSNLTGLSTFSGDYNDLTNAPTNLSSFSNDVGFITSYTETSTLNDILGRDNTSAIGISVGVVTSSGGFNLGISSAGTSITSGPVTTLNFIGAGNTFAVNGTTVDISIAGGGGGASVSISTTPPTSPSEGDLWYSSILGRTFIYYIDEDSSQWVDSAPFNPTEPTSTPGKTSATFAATEGQTTFTFSYTVGYIDVFLNGIRLNSAEYIATNGSTIALLQGATAGDILDVVEYRMGIGDTGPSGPPASLTIGTRSGGVTQSIAGVAFTVSLRSGIGTVTF